MDTQPIIMNFVAVIGGLIVGKLLNGVKNKIVSNVKGNIKDKIVSNVKAKLKGIGKSKTKGNPDSSKDTDSYNTPTTPKLVSSEHQAH